MKATVVNHSPYPLKSVKATVRWTLRELDADMSILAVGVRDTKQVSHHGRFYGDAEVHSPRIWDEWMSTIPYNGVRHLCVVRVPEWPIGKHDRGFKTGPPPIDPEDWIESLVCIVAHEATHLRQYLRQGKPRFSEVEAEWAEHRLLRRWRGR